MHSIPWKLYVGNLAYNFEWQQVKDLFRDAGIKVTRVDVLKDLSSGESKGCALVEVPDQYNMDRAIDKLDKTDFGGRRLQVREDLDPYRPMPSALDAKGGKGGKGGKDFGGGKGGKAGNNWTSASYPIHSVGYPVHGKSGKKGGAFDDNASASGRFASNGWKGESGKGGGGKSSTAAPGKTWRDIRDTEPEVPTRVYLGNLSYECDWKQIKDLCRQFQLEVRHADVITDAKTNTSKGCALVEFSRASEARRAIAKLNGLEVDGRCISAREDRDSSHNPSGVHSSTHPASTQARGDVTTTRRPPLQNPLSSSQKGASAPHGSKRSHEAVQDDQRRLFAENLSPNVDWKQLKDFFQGHFHVEYADIIRGDQDEAYGVIEFSSRQDALEACMTFNGVLLDDKQLRLRQDRGEFNQLREQCRDHVKRLKHTQDEPSHKRSHDKSNAVFKSGQSDPACRVYVGNLTYRVSWQDLKDHMSTVGPVKFCDVLKDRDSGKSKGCGIVEFEDPEDADRAIIEMHDTELQGRPILVREDREQ